MAETSNAREVVEKLRSSDYIERRKYIRRIAGTKCELYDLNNHKVEVRAENIEGYLAKGFTVEAKTREELVGQDGSLRAEGHVGGSAEAGPMPRTEKTTPSDPSRDDDLVAAMAAGRHEGTPTDGGHINGQHDAGRTTSADGSPGAAAAKTAEQRADARAASKEKHDGSEGDNQHVGGQHPEGGEAAGDAEPSPITGHAAAAQKRPPAPTSGRKGN